MIRTLIAATALAAALPAGAADTWAVDPAHSETTFVIRHLLSKVSGRFDSFDARIVTDAAKPESSSVEFTIQAASIDTNNDKRDAHLRSADFFDVEKHPTITFKSTAVKDLGGGKHELTGDLTMHGVTKPVTLAVTFLGAGPTMRGAQRAGFEATGTINRKDFGIVWNTTLDQGGTMLGDDVAITIGIEAVEHKDQPAEGKK
jgi:polyisoprenoid-binding protein YceI